MSDTKLEDLSRRYKQINGQYANKFEVVRMLPTDDAVDAYPKGCVAKIPGNDNFPIGMQLLNNMPQTYETCKIGASLEFSDIKYDELQRIKNNDIQKSPGLKFLVVDGYFTDNTLYFLMGHDGTAPTELKSGETLDITNLDKGTNGYLKTARNAVSVEWQGYVIPDETGNWNFSLSSDDASYMWLGNHALYDYKTSNAQIKNGGVHVNVQKKGSIYLIKNQIYPLRIQYGNNNEYMNFSFSITSPTGVVKTNNVIFILKKEGKFYEMAQRYFALVENPSSIGQYSCYIADSGDPAQQKNLKIENISSNNDTKKTIIKDIWHGLDSKNPTEVTKIKSGNYAKFDATVGGLVLYDSNGGVLKNFKIDDPANLAPNPAFRGFLIQGGGNVYLKVTYTKKDNSSGNAYIAKTPLVSEAVASSLFNDEMLAKKTSDKNAANYINMNERIDNMHSLYTSDKKYKFTINSKGNLKLQCAIEACKSTGKIGNNSFYVYTKSNEQARYLYGLDIDEKENKYFYSDNVNHTMEMIPANNNSKTGGVLGFTDFLKIGDYMPESKTGAFLVTGLDKCKANCISSGNCDSFYYQETTDNKKLCFKNSSGSGILPLNSMNPFTPDNRLKSSSLYIKDKQLDMSSKYMPERISTNDIKSYDGYAIYSTSSISGTPFISPHPVGVNSTPQMIQLNQDVSGMIWGRNSTPQQISSTINQLQNTINSIFPSSSGLGVGNTRSSGLGVGNTSTSGLGVGNTRSSGWGVGNTRSSGVSGNSISSRTPQRQGFATLQEGLLYNSKQCSGNSNGCISDITNTKINPLIQKADDYKNAVEKTNTIYQSIQSNLTNYNNLRTDLSNNPIYKFNDDPSEDYNPTKKGTPTVLDGLNDDANEMLLQQNNMYLMGTLTTASLLILAIILSK